MERNFVSLDSSFSPTAVAAPLQTAPSAGPEGTHSGKKAEVKESSSSTSPSAQAAAAQSERLTAPYDRELFQAFVAAATRLFCDDEQIILADFLVSEERAFTEKDLVERLGWPERRLREVCASLEKLLFVQREQLRTLPQTARDAAGPDNEGSSSTIGSSTDSRRERVSSGALLGASGGGGLPVYFRISPYAVIVCQYRLDQLEAKLLARRREVENRDAFVCPACGAQFDCLEAQRLRQDPQDAHFLCECGERLEQEDAKALQDHLASLHQRCQEQLHGLRVLIRKTCNMRVPAFPPFSRSAEGRDCKSGSAVAEESLDKRTAPSTVESSASGASDTQLSGGGVWSAEGDAAAPWGREDRGRQTAARFLAATPVGEQRTRGQTRNKQHRERGDLSWRWKRDVSQRRIHPTTTATTPTPTTTPTTPNSLPAPHRLQRQEPPAPRQTNAGQVSESQNPLRTAPSKLPATGGGGARGQIKFSMRPSSRNHKTRPTPARKVGDPQTRSAAGLPDETGSASSLSAPPQLQPQLQPQPQAQTTSAEASAALQKSEGAVRESVEESRAGAASEDAPTVFILRLGKHFSLEEAAELQLEMSHEEHEKFMELQSLYLDI